MIRRPDTQETKQFLVVADGIEVLFDDDIDASNYYWKLINEKQVPVQMWEISKKLYMSRIRPTRKQSDE